jgi:hypothetical protein
LLLVLLAADGGAEEEGISLVPGARNGGELEAVAWEVGAGMWCTHGVIVVVTVISSRLVIIVNVSVFTGRFGRSEGCFESASVATEFEHETAGQKGIAMK